MTITVYGIPAPQGSKKFLGIKGGRGILVESSKAVKPWREAVKWAAREQMAATGVSSPLVGPIYLHISFSLPRPPSIPKTREFPDRKPDLSKLIRSTEDALTDAGIWEDDARVIEIGATKIYGALPGAVITVEQVYD